MYWVSLSIDKGVKNTFWLPSSIDNEVENMY